MTGKRYLFSSFIWRCSICSGPRRTVSLDTSNCKHCRKLTLSYAVLVDSVPSRRDKRLDMSRRAGTMRNITSEVAKSLGVRPAMLTERIVLPRKYSSFRSSFVSTFSYGKGNEGFTIQQVENNYPVMDSSRWGTVSMKRLASKDQKKSILVRVPIPLKEWLSSYCEKTEQSMTFVIVSLLEQLKNERESICPGEVVSDEEYLEV